MNNTYNELKGKKWGELTKETQLLLLKRYNLFIDDNWEQCNCCIIDFENGLSVIGERVIYNSSDEELIIDDNSTLYDPVD